MEHCGKGRAWLVERPDSFAGEADSLVTLEHGSKFAAVTSGDDTVALADGGRNMRDLEAGGLSRMNGAAQRLEGFHKEGTHEKWLEAAALGLFHLLLHSEQAFGTHGFLREGITFEDASKGVAVEGVFNTL